VYLEQVHPLHYIPIPSLSVLSGFHHAVFICTYVAFFHPLHPSVSFPYPSKGVFKTLNFQHQPQMHMDYLVVPLQCHSQNILL
jgi:hypothetical protein